MKYIFDHSKDKAFEDAGLEPSYKKEWDLFAALQAKLSAPSYDEARVALLYELAIHWEECAREYGAELEIVASEDYHLASLTWRGDLLEVFRIEESSSKTALSLALQKANSVHFSTENGKLQIFTVVNLYK